jgi:hypothetical protein
VSHIRVNQYARTGNIAPTAWQRITTEPTVNTRLVAQSAKSRDIQLHPKSADFTWQNRRIYNNISWKGQTTMKLFSNTLKIFGKKYTSAEQGFQHVQTLFSEW